MDKVLVTGGTGFLGSWIVRILCNSGYKPILLVRPGSNLNRLTGLENIEIRKVDSDLWGNSVQEISPSALIALDWTGVGNAARNDRSQFENIDRIIGVAKGAMEAGVGHYIGFGSQAEVGPYNSLITEIAPTNPTTEYGRAKCHVRIQLEELFDGSGIKFSWGRIFSTYGQMDSPVWFIPQMINAFATKKEFAMTKGEQNWNYLHAYDFATAVLTLLNTNQAQGTINIAHPKSQALVSVAKTVASKMDSVNLLKIGAVSYRDDQVFQMIPDTNKLLLLGWKPEIDLQNGLNQLIEWSLGKSSNLILSNGNVLKLPKCR